MKEEIEDAKRTIKKHFSVNDSYEILFPGAGCTSAINYLLKCIDFRHYTEIDIFISTLEHFSNHLPWIELEREYKKTTSNMRIRIHTIPLLKESSTLDYDWFHQKSSEVCVKDNTKSRSEQLIILSVIHTSNVTGYSPNHKRLLEILEKNACKRVDKYFFTDMAASAPYVKVDGSMYDAIFFSGHKFLGGPGSPGVLIAKTCLFKKDHSAAPGGSCIKKTRGNKIEYSSDIEQRESAGTPDIIGIIKLKLCILLKDSNFRHMCLRERVLCDLIKKKTRYFLDKYPGCFFVPVPPTSSLNSEYRLPIFSFHLKDVHYNLCVKLLNDIFAIQARGGICCCGLYADFIEKHFHWRGVVRVSFHWLMSDAQVARLFRAIEFVVENGSKYKKRYRYCSSKNLYIQKRKTRKCNLSKLSGEKPPGFP
jgi:selenocysteine lyase/cysteine desulfurase